MRRGTTLPELALVLVIVGLTAAIALPSLARTMDRLAVESAAVRLAAAHGIARIAAIHGNAVAVLSVSADSLIIDRIRGNDTLRIWARAGPAEDRVALTAPSRPIAFSPVGLAIGVANRTYRLTRGSAQRAVIVSRLGRVRIQR